MFVVMLLVVGCRPSLEGPESPSRCGPAAVGERAAGHALSLGGQVMQISDLSNRYGVQVIEGPGLGSVLALRNHLGEEIWRHALGANVSSVCIVPGRSVFDLDLMHSRCRRRISIHIAGGKVFAEEVGCVMIGFLLEG